MNAPILISTLFDGITNASSGITTKLITFYTTGLFPILMIVGFILIAITKDPKKLEMEKAAIKWAIIVFIGVNCITLITQTIDWLINLIKG